MKEIRQWMYGRLLAAAVLLFFSWSLVGCTPANSEQTASSQASPEQTAIEQTGTAVPANLSSADSSSRTETTATFAGGCFWCMEQPFDDLPGVVSTVSGYTGGTVENPTYNQVSSGNTGHVEAMQVTYDPAQVTYDTLLQTFWHNIDPLDNAGQFCDKGSQYRSAIFYDSAEQQAIAQASKQAVADRLNQPVATDILPAATFYPAEDYHQNYYQTHPVRYKVYRFGCGRDQRLSEIWGADAPDHG
ncbi:MAG: peptide-methionine (S)-S-oxide reductase MsrA [Cyanobacteria bacterium J06623_4]